MEVRWASRTGSYDATLDFGKKLLRINSSLGKQMGRPAYIRMGFVQDKGRRGIVVAKAASAEVEGAYEVYYARDGSSTGQFAIGRALTDEGIEQKGNEPMLRLKAAPIEVEKKQAWVLWLP